MQGVIDVSLRNATGLRIWTFKNIYHLKKFGKSDLNGKYGTQGFIHYSK